MPRFGLWILNLEVSMELGAWNLKFPERSLLSQSEKAFGTARWGAHKNCGGVGRVGVRGCCRPTGSRNQSGLLELEILRKERPRQESVCARGSNAEARPRNWIVRADGTVGPFEGAEVARGSP